MKHRLVALREKLKCLLWFGWAPFILIPIAMMFDGQLSRALGLLAVFSSMFLGLVLGGKFAQLVSTYLLKTSKDISERLNAACCAFGFVFAPVQVGSFTNANLGTDIDLPSIYTLIFWACVGAVIFFCINPASDKE